MIDKFRQVVRAWRARRALASWRRHHAAMKRAKRTYRNLTAEPERLGLPELVERLAIAATPHVPAAHAEALVPALMRRCAALAGRMSVEYLSITRVTGRKRGRHYGARSAARATASPRSTGRPGAHRAIEVVETAARTTRRAVGDFTSGAGRQVRRHYRPRSWGFDNHRSRFWSIADGWAATA